MHGKLIFTEVEKTAEGQPTLTVASIKGLDIISVVYLDNSAIAAKAARRAPAFCGSLFEGETIEGTAMD